MFDKKTIAEGGATDKPRKRRGSVGAADVPTSGLVDRESEEEPHRTNDRGPEDQPKRRQSREPPNDRESRSRDHRPWASSHGSELEWSDDC